MKIVILHGWGQDKRFWDTFAAPFRKGDVVVFDLPGFGSEPHTVPDWGVPEYAEWVTSKIESIPPEGNDIVLLGHSFGGRIASYIASKDPRWLKGLILYAAPSIRRPKFSTRLKIAGAHVLKTLGVRGRGGNPELREAEQKGMGELFRKAVSFDQTALLKKITVPTLLIWGDRDDVVPLSIAREMQRLIPNSKLTTIERAGHNAHLKNPHLFYGIVKRFIEGL
ncbi:MAG: alpha/beta hydrolase [Minisyncoccia bacterium]|jgi:pimeloyl-ACP methyl ester carboxylesterase